MDLDFRKFLTTYGITYSEYENLEEGKKQELLDRYNSEKEKVVEEEQLKKDEFNKEKIEVKKSKDKKPFYKKIWVWILVVLILSVVYWGNQPATENYKSDARKITWLELVDNKVSGMEKVTFNGEVSETSEDGKVLLVVDNDGIYYVKNIEKSNIKVNDKISIWGVYVGDEKTTGFPIIEAKVIEKK